MHEIVIDPSFIERLQALGGIKLRNDLIAMFLERTPEKLAQIENGVIGPDYQMIQLAAHSLISSAGNLGGSGLSRSAAKIEAAALDGNETLISQELSGMKVLYLEFKQHLEAILEDQ